MFLLLALRKAHSSCRLYGEQHFAARIPTAAASDLV